MINKPLGKQIQHREKNDCTVDALAIALEIDYLQAYGYLLGHGRKYGKGFVVEPVYDNLEGVKKFAKPNMTVGRFISEVACFGNWIIKIQGHAFAVKNGVIFDIRPEGNINRHVICAWRVK